MPSQNTFPACGGSLRSSARSADGAPPEQTGHTPIPSIIQGAIKQWEARCVGAAVARRADPSGRASGRNWGVDLLKRICRAVTAGPAVIHLVPPIRRWRRSFQRCGPRPRPSRSRSECGDVLTCASRHHDEDKDIPQPQCSARTGGRPFPDIQNWDFSHRQLARHLGGQCTHAAQGRMKSRSHFHRQTAFQT